MEMEFEQQSLLENLPVLIKYSKRGSARKNTLFGYKDKEVIYFGIARCHLTEDMFVKKTGRTIAQRRANKIIHQIMCGKIPNDLPFFIDHTSLKGYCKLSHLQVLKDYFYMLEHLGVDACREYGALVPTDTMRNLFLEMQALAERVTQI